MVRRNHREPAKTISPLSILVADDTRDLRVLIARWLEEAGHTVTDAANGREIVDLVKDRSFDLIVTDILMPDGDGWNAIAAVRRLNPDTKILAISGGAREMPATTVLRAAHRAGALGFLAKPFSRPEFIEAVARVMAGRKMRTRPPMPV